MSKAWPLLTMLIGVMAIVGTIMAMGDRFIAKATFSEFKEHVIYRLEAIDRKLDVIIDQQEKK